MIKILHIVLGWAMSNLLAKVLASIGFAVLGGLVFNQFIEYFINKAINQLSNIPMIGLLGVAGVDTAISILISSILIRLYLSTVVQSLKFVRKK